MTVDDLRVYKKLFELAVKISDHTLRFPRHELYELGSQLRRSSNSGPANLAEGFDNKHTNIYLECISRAKGEIRETIHHLKMAFRKNCLSDVELNNYMNEYTDSLQMLYGLELSLLKTHKK